MDNNLITLVPTQGAFIVHDRSGKYCVTLFPKESYQCPSTTTCFHILAANMSIGQEPIEKRSVVNLRLLKKNTRKRVDKKSGKKQPRPNDRESIVEPAPDSAFITNTPKTPSSILSTKNTDKKDVHRSSRKTPISKKKLHFNLDTIQEDRSSCSDDFADLPDLHCLFKKIKLELFCFTSFSGGLHIEFNQQLMRGHLISCLENAQFSVFPPKVKVSKKCTVKCKSSVVESNCECGKTDSIENIGGM